jgi:hypothetical protein
MRDNERREISVAAPSTWYVRRRRKSTEYCFCKLRVLPGNMTVRAKDRAPATMLLTKIKTDPHHVTSREIKYRGSHTKQNNKYTTTNANSTITGL